MALLSTYATTASYLILLILPNCGEPYATTQSKQDPDNGKWILSQSQKLSPVGLSGPFGIVEVLTGCDLIVRGQSSLSARTCGFKRKREMMFFL
ncbi:hypothetical protein BDV23DRAFT_128887 [Aspergillus alliaceus]|uniref:Secreted protein n=1 Tax=Petromyces alliaceus TaxID=209559 RepID=A0A5N7BZL5_PETAA|nr:hypothetical protein BDV23DRAFT_128887 [Aspergillus alliaceus]